MIDEIGGSHRPRHGDKEGNVDEQQIDGLAHEEPQQDDHEEQRDRARQNDVMRHLADLIEVAIGSRNLDHESGAIIFRTHAINQICSTIVHGFGKGGVCGRLIQLDQHHAHPHAFFRMPSHQPGFERIGSERNFGVCCSGSFPGIRL